MEPSFEERLREEVIYLHSLWHKGPPSASAGTLHPHTHPYLQPSASTQFKNAWKNPNSKKSKNKFKTRTQRPPPADSGKEWPCPPITDPSSAGPSGWPVFAKPDPNSVPPSPERVVRLIAYRAQSRALKTVEEFFKSMSAGSDSDESMDGVDEEEVGSDYFAKLFEEDGELREYYVKNWEKGDFCCLICSGLGKSKGFKDCMALVQHTITISRTKKKKLHREYGKVVCKLLGWEIDKLPTIVSMLSEKRNANGMMNNSCQGKGESQVNLENGNKNVKSNTIDHMDSVNDTNNVEIDSGAEQLLENFETTEPEAKFEDGSKDVESNVGYNVDSINEHSNGETQGKEGIGAEQCHSKCETTKSVVDTINEHSNEETQGKEGIPGKCETTTSEVNVGNSVKDTKTNVVDNVDPINENVKEQVPGDECTSAQQLPHTIIATECKAGIM